MRLPRRMTKRSHIPATVPDPFQTGFRSDAAAQPARAGGLSGKAGEIAAVLEHKLVMCDYRFGEALSIYALAEQFDASRQPVATAVNYLRDLGYLEIIPQVGCRVVSPSGRDIIDFYRAYSKTEGVIAALAAERYTGAEADRLVAMAEYLPSLPFSTWDDYRRYGELVTEFLKLTGQMARSPALLARISGLRRLSRFYLWQGPSERKPAAATTAFINESRIALARAILARDAGAAERIADENMRIYPEWVGIVETTPAR